MSRLGVICGIAYEATLLERAARSLDAADSLVVRCAAGGAGRARQAAESAVAAGAVRLLSFGIAGGLDPALRPGTLLLAEAAVAVENSGYRADAAWTGRLETALFRSMSCVRGTLAGSDVPVASPAAKAALQVATGAKAVDMESWGVAAVAATTGIPFAIVRAVADPAWRAVPKAALAGLDGEGRTRPGAVLRELARRPWEAISLARVAADSAVAFAALRRAAPLLLAGVVGR